MILYHFKNKSDNSIFLFAKCDKDMKSYEIFKDICVSEYELAGKYQLNPIGKIKTEIKAVDVDYSDGM